MKRGFRGILLVAGILAMTAASANAQAIGSIFGKVTDPSNAVLPGVTVTVSGPAMQQPLVAVTGASGTYQFPSVPIGTFTVTFELNSFKKVVRSNVIITTGFNAQIDQKLEVGAMSAEMTVTAATPVVDTKKTATGGTFTKEILEAIPTARDPWQIINMAPGVQAGINVGGSASGQQVGLNYAGTGANVQWNLEGGSITDLSSNSSPSYFNFDSFEQIQVVTGGGDVSVQSSGLSINLVTKSGSNVFKGTAVYTFENDSMQGQNVSAALFATGANGFISGAPLQKITNASAEYGGPILRNRIWFWGAMDKQDINNGVLNFFDPRISADCATYDSASRNGSLSALVTYANLSKVQACLTNDKTVIKDIEWKINHQFNASNKLQWLFTSDNKYRNHRGASSSTALEATFQQTSDAPWKLPLPTQSLTHTMIVTDRLVFNNQFTYVGGGFFLDYQDVTPYLVPGRQCGQSRFIPGETDPAKYVAAGRTDPACIWSTQSQTNRTTGYRSGSPQSSYQTVRHSWELKTDGTYFVTNQFGGDHSLKFGFGWRRNPILSFSHYSGGAQVSLQCVGNNSTHCGNGVIAPVGATDGLVPYNATLWRDSLVNNTWHTYNGYLQDSFSRGKVRINGGIRYDWQTSKWLGGCVAASNILPAVLPSQCETATNVDSITGKAIQAFGSFGPRISATYDLFGNGKTQVHASGGYYYATKITLANSLGGLFSQPALTWGNNQSSGACSTTAGTNCWNDANGDGKVQANELIGPASSGNARFNTTTGIFAPAGNLVDPSAKIGRTREFIVGAQHELIQNFAIGADYTYRKYDRGTSNYLAGYQPGCATNAAVPCVGFGFPLSQLYVGPTAYVEPTTGTSANYYTVCAGCTRPSGLATITMTNLNYQVYKGVTVTANKRFSNKWQLNGSVTRQYNPQYYPAGSATYVDPTGLEYVNGFSNLTKYLIKLNGSYALPWQVNVSANLNWNAGGTRNLSVNGPGNVYGGTSGTISKNTLIFQPTGTTRFLPTKLLDFGVQKVIPFRGGKNRLKLSLDGFNIFNVATITAWSSSNINSTNFTVPTSIVPPRVFRVGASIAF
jgi:hypothetical protein